MIYGELMHSSHPEHKLKLEHEETAYKCNGCREIGFGIRYKCPFNSCNFHLHKYCASPELTITHPFFPDCVFLFLELPDRRGNYCDACGRDIEGYNYHCFEKGPDLHPNCAMLGKTMPLEGGSTLNLKKKMSSKCYQCGEKKVQMKRKSWSYVSTCKKCHLHVACVKDMLIKNWEKECLGRVDGEASDAKPLVKKAPKLEIVLQEGKRSKSKRFAKKMVTIAIPLIMAAVLGDPTALVTAVLGDPTALVTAVLGDPTALVTSHVAHIEGKTKHHEGIRRGEELQWCGGHDEPAQPDKDRNGCQELFVYYSLTKELFYLLN